MLSLLETSSTHELNLLCNIINNVENQLNHQIIGKVIAVALIIILLHLAPYPTNSSRELINAKQAIAEKNYLAAAKYLSKVAEEIPWRKDLWEHAANYALLGGDDELGIRFFVRSNALGTLSAKGKDSLGLLYQKQGNLMSAIQIWESAISDNAGTLETYNHLIDAYRELGDLPNAIRISKNLLELNILDHQTNAEVNYQIGLMLAAYKPNSAPAYLSRAIEYDSNKRTQANKLIRKINSAAHMDEPAYTLLSSGRVLREMQEWELASYAFQKAVELRPDYAEAWAFLSETYQEMDIQNGTIPPQRGLDEINIALDLDPDSFAVNAIAAIYWQRQGEYEHALEYLEKSASIDSNNPDILIDMGNAWAAIGDLSKAQSLYQKAMELSPRNPAYLRALAEFCIRYEINLKELALPTAREAVRLSPDNPASLDVLGQVLFLLKDNVDAKKFFLRALETNYNYAPAHLHLGVLYLVQGYQSLAFQYLHQAYQLATDNSTKQQVERILENYTSP